MGWPSAKAMRRSRHRAVVILIAFLLDRCFGDPPNRFHPVAWMGSLLTWLRGRAPTTGRALPFAYGLLSVIGGMAAWGGVGKLVISGCGHLPGWLGLLVEALLFKSTFALTGLDRAAAAVEAPLLRADLERARQQLQWHLVSRDTVELNEAQVAAATIESVAENASDGVLAPLFYYAVGGLPAALGYRFLNTADAMWGYRDPAREWLGKAAARLDDLANLLPARLTALALLFGVSDRASWQRGWRVWWRDANCTVSPNAGHPMSAMAGVLGVELEKVGHYRLGAAQNAATAADIQRARGLLQRAMVGLFGIVALLLWWLGSHRDG